MLVRNKYCEREGLQGGYEGPYDFWFRNENNKERMQS